MLSALSNVLLAFPEDQLRYLGVFVVSFPLSIIFRRLLSYRYTPVWIRHLFHVTLGLCFGLFCFEVWENLIFVIVVGVAYFLLWSVKPSIVHWVMLVYSLMCVVGAHSFCMYRDYGGWKMTFTGPLMILVQKLTYVSCEVLDGMGRSEDKLSEEQKRLQLKERPSLLEFFSYSFSFVSFLAGPTCSFKEYNDYITGTNMIPLENPNQYAKAKEHSKEPSPLYPVLVKSSQAIGSLLVYAVSSKYISKDVLLDKEVNILSRFVYTSIFLISLRCLYYFSFIISEAVCNTSGLGFHGYDERGVAKWDLLNNVKIMEVEFGVNFRSVVSSWHIMSALWLRRCVYERVPYFATGATFMTSAVWHGIYPGYHLTFFSFFCVTEASRKLRQRLHSHFQSPSWLKTTYDILTTAVTMVARDWAAVPFVLLTFNKSLIGISNHYFCPIVLCLPILLLIPGKSTGKSREKKKPHTN